MGEQRVTRAAKSMVSGLIVAMFVLAFSPPAQWLPFGTAAMATSSEDAVRQTSLDTLFRKLETAADAAEARVTTGEIWDVWLQSGDPAIDKEMREVVRAMNLQHFGTALSVLDKMVKKVPGYAEAWNKRATVNYLVHRFDASLADIEKTLALEPRHFGALAGKAAILTSRGEKKAALETIEQALKINPFLTGAKSMIEQNGGVYRPQRGI